MSDKIMVKKQTTLKFNKKQFLRSDLGSILEDSINKIWFSIIYPDSPYAECYEAYMLAVEALLTVLKQCYGVNYYYVENRDVCGIASNDGKGWLYKCENKQKKKTKKGEKL